MFRIRLNSFSPRVSCIQSAAKQLRSAAKQLRYTFLAWWAHQCPIFLIGNRAHKTSYFYSQNAYCPICPILLAKLKINDEQDLYSAPCPITKFTKTWDKWDTSTKTPCLHEETVPHCVFFNWDTPVLYTRRSNNG